ncbi:MAG: DUF2784 domain-containing protein [Saprospiraceae bacterium]|nr:DUF2784 domain-containing protein [Saprospiraceae bacterium]
MYHFLHYFFLLFHLLLILFNLTGWIWKRTRRAHLLVICLTLASWTLLGFFYGVGYCPLTDWHWAVLEKIGKTDLPNSYLKYLLDLVTGMDWNAKLVDGMAVAGLAIALIGSLWANFGKREAHSPSAD